MMAGPSNVKLISRSKLFELMQQTKLPNLQNKLDFLENDLLGRENFNEEQIKEIKHNFSRFKSEIRSRWAAAHNKEDDFLKKNIDWLAGTFTLPKVIERPGRPEIRFQESSDRSKRRKTEELRSCVDLEVLTHATQVQLTASGKRDAGKVLKEIISSPKRATKYKQVFSECEKVGKLGSKTSQMSPNQALSIFVEANLSKSQYETIRNSNKNIYPCYSILQQAKKECYPEKEAISVSETCAEVNIQALLDHTSKRLLLNLDEVLETLSKDERNSLELTCKWGCDGSQQAQYKQTFNNIADSDSNIFQSSFVPLRLLCRINNKVIWQNPTPSSPRYCRPIRIRFVKESTDITLEEIEHVESATNALNVSAIPIKDKIYYVTYIMIPTMVDGKVCNAATKTKSTLRCYICGLTSTTFNDLTKTAAAPVKPDALKFGLSILHVRIRIFESLLHLAYKLPLKKGRLNKKKDNVAIVHQRKAEIQEEFRVKMGLLVDKPKQGFGNTSRRFFSNPELAAEITGVDLRLINRFKVILETISSGHKINLDKFTIFTNETAKLYVELYPWCRMTPTMHKLLIHGPVVIENALLPIGQLSEEAAEARNRHFRLYRQNFSRKFSRVSCNRDVLNRLLMTSDPLITGMRATRRKKTKPFSTETLDMLLPMEPHAGEVVSDDDEISTELQPSSSDESEMISD